MNVRGIKVSLNIVLYNPFIFALPAPHLALQMKETKSKANAQTSTAGQNK